MFGDFTPQMWLILGVLMIIAEIYAIYGVGFLFLGLGSLTTAVLLFKFPILYSSQITTVGLSSIVWFLILWYPLKNFRNKKNHTTNGVLIRDLVGSDVKVISEQIAPGEVGEVAWSGTIMKAKLLKNSSFFAYKGEMLCVEKVKGNMVFCSRKNIDFD